MLFYLIVNIHLLHSRTWLYPSKGAQKHIWYIYFENSIQNQFISNTYGICMWPIMDRVATVCMIWKTQKGRFEDSPRAVSWHCKMSVMMLLINKLADWSLIYHKTARTFPQIFCDSLLEDPRGRYGCAPLPLVQLLSFSCSFRGKSCQIIGWRQRLASPVGKFWIRHCSSSNQ